MKQHKDRDNNDRQWKIPEIHFDGLQTVKECNDETLNDRSDSQERKIESYQNERDKQKGIFDDDGCISEIENDDNDMNHIVQQMNCLPVTEDLHHIHKVEVQGQPVDRIRPKLRTYVQYKLGEGWFKEIISSQPKRTDINKDWVNIQIDSKSNPKSVDWIKISS